MMTEFRVLARAYRPQTFDDLVGQEALVRTLRNGIEAGRIAHAFVLTGIRGIGKTTTARIIAKALNCTGANDEFNAPTTKPCGVCSHCTQIRDDRHVDVIEMDAASHTGVGDMRDLIDSVHYKPSSGRYKVYIIDEAHMLSNSAFNALLKTLEEPPAHVIFIFATTEIRKIPVTILSRCQRFDLRRLSAAEMVQHLQTIAGKEKVEIEQDALELIAIASEGSVRDALSLLDQAIAHSDRKQDGSFHITTQMMRDLLGLVDRTRLYDMLSALFAGDASTALERLRGHYHDGANMLVLLQDMLQAVHIISRKLVTPHFVLDQTYAEHEKKQIETLAGTLSIAATSKAWQLLLKGLDEVKKAPDALSATEMLFIRFAYAANLPDPDKVIKLLQEKLKEGSGQGNTAIAPAQTQPAPMLSLAVQQPAHALAVKPVMEAQPHSAPHLHLVEKAVAEVHSFEDIVALLESKREQILLHHVRQEIRLVSCKQGELVIGAASTIAQSYIQKLQSFLHEQTGKLWRIIHAKEEGEATLQQQAETSKAARMEAAKFHPIVATLLETFADATIVDVS